MNRRNTLLVTALTLTLFALGSQNCLVSNIKGIVMQNSSSTIAKSMGIKNGSHITSGQCDSSLNNFVYHPRRLHVVQDCITVTGIVDVVRSEADGDLHILLNLDPQFANYTNQVNKESQQGDLVLEPICQHTITQSDAVDACSNYDGPIFQIPALGSHIQVTGRYVLDDQHGGWAEEHPVSVLKVLSEPSLQSAIHIKKFTTAQLEELAREDEAIGHK
jgi:hypothetical protein